MKKKVLAGFFLATLICGFAFAQDSKASEAGTGTITYQAENTDTRAEEEFSFLLMNYFKDKNPSLVQVTVNFFRERQLVTEDMQMPLVGFYAELFRDKKIKENHVDTVSGLWHDTQ